MHDNDVAAAYQATADLAWLGDRDADLWMPLFAVCSVASPGRFQELKKCSVVLSGKKSEDDGDDSTDIRLLADIRTIWPDDAPYISTADLLKKVKGLDESPWNDFDLNPRKLARKLRPFGIASKDKKHQGAVFKAYQLSEFTDAWGRYL